MHGGNTISAAHRRWAGPEFYLAASPMVTSANPAGLSFFDSTSLSGVRFDFTKRNGGFVNYNESDDSYIISLSAKSLYRLNSTIVMSGGIAYEFANGNNMSGSALIDPYYNCFDICEFDDANQGRKRLERYHVLTTIAYRPKIGHVDGLSFGAGFDFTSANYSKMKDLRHSNDYSDLKLSMAASYEFQSNWSVGAAYHFRKSVEGILFERFSPGDLHHEMLVSYGGFWGKRKSFEENSGQISKTKTPIHNWFHGVSVQVQLIKPVHFFLECKYDRRHCNYGHKSPNSILYNNFKGHHWDVNAKLIFNSNNSKSKIDGLRHIIGFEAEGNPVISYESIWKSVHHSSGETEYQYYEPKEVGKSDNRLYSLDYRLDSQVYLFKAKFTLYDINRSAYIYPYYRNQRLMPFRIQASLQRDYQIKKLNLVTSSLLLGYGDSFLLSLDDGTYLPDPTQVKPATSEIFQQREEEFLTQSQIFISPKLRYTRDVRKFLVYFECNYTWTRALEAVTSLNGPSAHKIILSVGLLF